MEEEDEDVWFEAQDSMGWFLVLTIVSIGWFMAFNVAGFRWRFGP